VRAIDALLTCAYGQRIGIFAGSGIGKSTLLGMIARNTAAEVNVIALIGERGREVREFIEDSLGEQGLQRSVLVVATSDQPAIVRQKAAFTATAIAEYFRDQGRQVLLMMDSLTRAWRWRSARLGCRWASRLLRAAIRPLYSPSCRACWNARGQQPTRQHHRALHCAGGRRRPE
jgi:flagellar biosynthesis/type III secretory pathway ATPase